MKKVITIFCLSCVPLFFVSGQIFSQNAVTITFPFIEGNYTGANMTYLTSNSNDSNNLPIGNKGFCLNVTDNTFHSCSCITLDITDLSKYTLMSPYFAVFLIFINELGLNSIFIASKQSLTTFTQLLLFSLVFKIILDTVTSGIGSVVNSIGSFFNSIG